MRKQNTGDESHKKRRKRAPKRTPNRKPKQKTVKLTSDELDDIKDHTDWDRVESLTDADIDRAISDDRDVAPVLDDTFWRNAQILDPDHEKTVITMRVDDDVLEFFKAGGSGYQTRMNAVLRAYVYARREGAR